MTKWTEPLAREHDNTNSDPRLKRSPSPLVHRDFEPVQKFLDTALRQA